MKTFVTADPHFGHAGVCKFMSSSRPSEKLRPWNTPEDMDRDMVALWNTTVGTTDKVYLLGDVVINRKALPTLGLLNGRKVLIKGNHDIFHLEDYTPYFSDIRAYHVLNNCILSHIPIHPMNLYRFQMNIHGHLHDGFVKLEDGTPDKRYKCVSVEHTGFKPVELHTLFG